MEIYNLISFSGIFLLIGFAWLISGNRENVNWRAVAYGTSAQLAVAAFLFLLPQGTRFFLAINDIVVNILDSAGAGTRFLFGRLALGPGATNEAGETSLGFILAFQAFPVIIFFAALAEVFNYLKILPYIIRKFSLFFSRFLSVSGAESLSVSSNIFVGVESSLLIKPYIDKMTNSELCTVLTSGMATIASSMLGLYVFILHDKFPTIAGHLISASLLSAPAAVVMSKILLPETYVPETMGIRIRPIVTKQDNPVEAIIEGSQNGVRLIVGICALLISFLGLLELLDNTITACAGLIGSAAGMDITISIKDILGYIFYPFTLIIGVPVSDALSISQIIGERLVVTEVGSYYDLAALIKAGALNHPRSAVIATYALCGFAHIASLAIFVGGYAALSPKRTKTLSRLGIHALLAATLACLMTAAVSGTFFSSSSILLQN